jgi:HD-like signal output (HDOD) protein
MLRWLLALFGFSERKPPVPAGMDRRPGAGVPTRRSPPEEPEQRLPPEAARFLAGIATPCSDADLQELSADDRVFLSGILKRLRENRLEIPILPRAALEISRLLANPQSNLTDFVRVLTADPALSVDVLRIANSAYYGFSGKARSIREALVRIGRAQVRGLLVVSHLRSKVLQGGQLHREAGWLSELCSGLAHLGRALASPLGLRPDEAFTRGLLFHVEHFLVLGTNAEVSKQLQRRIHPSEGCLEQAFWRFGPKIRELAARAWTLDDLLESGQEDRIGARYAELRQALVASWTGSEPASVEGVGGGELRSARQGAARLSRGSGAGGGRITAGPRRRFPGSRFHSSRWSLSSGTSPEPGFRNGPGRQPCFGENPQKDVTSPHGLRPAYR